MKSYICLDIENDSVPESRYGRKAGNFLYDQIVAIGHVKNNQCNAVYYSPDDHYFLELLNKVDILVGHNLIHDLLFLWKLSTLQEFFKRGGKIHDTMYAEYLLSGQQLTYKDLSLRKLAVEKYGCKERPKNIENYLFHKEDFIERLNKDKSQLPELEQAILDDQINLIKTYEKVSDLPKEMVLKDVQNDVLDTEQIYLKQIEALEEAGMSNLLEGIMDFELATIEMTYNGMFINKEIFEKNKAVLKQELLNREIEFLHKIRNHIDSKNFNIRSSQQIATLLFGGEVKNEIVEPILTETGEFKYNKKGELKTHKVTVKEQIKGLGLQCPKQTPSGKNSTDDEVLSQLNHPLVKYLLEFRKVDKLHSTYYEGFQDCIYPDHRVHAEIQLETTATGRTSCRNPNLQNQPEQAGKLIKSHFTSRFGNVGTFVKADFSQIEVCVQAAISGDTRYIEDIVNGVDFHIKWVAISENMDYKEVERKVKVEKREDWITRRKRIKPVTFSMNYGASTWALSRDSGIPQYEIEKIIAGFEDEYFQLKQYYENLKNILEFTKEQAYIYGRWAYKGWYQSPTGRKYFFVTRESKYGQPYFHKPEYMNYIVQGTTFDIVAIMVGKMWREKAIHNRDKYLMVNFVHDEIDFDCKKEHLEQLQQDCQLLTNVREMMQEKFNFEFKVPIKIDVKNGESWSDCE